MASDMHERHFLMKRLNASTTQANITSDNLGSCTTQSNINDDYHAYQTSVSVEKYCIPVICILGFLGNTFSTATFLRRPLAKAPCSLYLAVRGISDNGFLLSLMLTWVSSTFELRLSQVKVVCQCIIFLTYVCGCVSVWLCVFITFDNFILIPSPLSAKRVCCVRVSKICTTVLVLFTVAVYNTSLWVIHADCSHNTEYTRLTQFLVYTDTMLTLILPTVLIFTLLSVITYKVIHILHIRRIHMSLLEKADSQRLGVLSKTPIPVAKVTKMLFIVSLVFLGLNLPIHIIRLWLLVGTFTKGGVIAPILIATLQTAFQLLYYLSFSINIIVYAVFGSNFRRVFIKTFCCHCFNTKSAYSPTEAVNRVRHRRHSFTGIRPPTSSPENGLLVPSAERLVHSDCH
ncbi:hypothetical protein DPMN_084029 [Dreissena polymorpha]|uniref:G-protein coupled receptors family 1 profile domain-containing protein n=1 Tax=Dreissena polymorpha TaxID=45954 RepID=A0A9D3YDL1_DREPO|nr:hypothetical protein DPMN_084029 [Dreissena polymorpha]